MYESLRHKLQGTVIPHTLIEVDLVIPVVWASRYCSLWTSNWYDDVNRKMRRIDREFGRLIYSCQVLEEPLFSGMMIGLCLAMYQNDQK
jgi:hypothetical protein